MLANFLLWVKWVLTNAKTVLSFVITLKSAQKSKEQEGPGERSGLLCMRSGPRWGGGLKQKAGPSQRGRPTQGLLPPGPERDGGWVFWEGEPGRPGLLQA